jgi:general stress protein YciG
MSGNAAGGKLAAAKNTAKEPGFYARIGSKGGSVKGPKGFALMDYEKHRAASFKGGSTSRRRAIPTDHSPLSSDDIQTLER